MWAEVVAATNIAAREAAERRGYLEFRIDKDSLYMFKKIVHCRAIEADGTASPNYTQSSFHGVKRYTVPETSEVNLNHDEKAEVEYSTKFASQTQWLNNGNADATERLSITENGESQERVYVIPHAVHMVTAHAYRRYNIASGQRRNRVHRAKILQCELETQGNFRIVVHPGHPIAKQAAVGGAAGAISGGTTGAIAGYMIGCVVGVVGGPPGMAAGSGLGCVIGGAMGAVAGAGLIGGVGSALGALGGIGDRCDIQFTITAEEVFQKLSNFRKVGNRVFCHVIVEARV